MTPDEVKKIAEELLNQIEIDPEVDTIVLHQLTTDEIEVLMRAFDCTLSQLSGKILAYKSGVSRL